MKFPHSSSTNGGASDMGAALWVKMGSPRGMGSLNSRSCLTSQRAGRALAFRHTLGGVSDMGAALKMGGDGISTRDGLCHLARRENLTVRWPP